MRYYVTSTEGSKVSYSTLMSPSPRWRAGLGSGRLGEDGNMIKGGIASFIAGGVGNTITGNCSAILGGSGNSDGGFAYTGIFGNGLVATAAPATFGVASALWSDALVIPGIPVIAGAGPAFTALPNGALYTTVAAPSPFGTRPVFVK